MENQLEKKSDQPEKDDKAIVGQILQSLLMKPLDELSLKTVKELVHKESESSIQERGKGTGFSEFKMGADRSRGICDSKNLPKLFQAWVDNPPECIMLLPKGKKDQLVKMMQEAVLNDSYEKQIFEINFCDGRGEVHFVTFMFSGKDNGKIQWMRAHMYGKFALAPDYMVIKHSKKSFFNSKTWDEIVYIPRALHENDIMSVLKTVFIPSILQLQAQLDSSDRYLQ